MIVSVFVRRLREGRTFADFIAAWEADEGFGVPTRVFSAQSLEDPRDIITIGFVAVSAEELRQWGETGSAPEAIRHDRIATVIESTEFHRMYEVHSEHDFTTVPREIGIATPESLLATLA